MSGPDESNCDTTAENIAFEEFRNGLPRGRFRIIFNPELAQRFVARRVNVVPVRFTRESVQWGAQTGGAELTAKESIHWSRRARIMGLTVRCRICAARADTLMPLPNFAHLQANPDSILAWLHNNLLFFRANTLVNVPNPPGTGNVTIIPEPGGAVAVNAQGVPMDVYTVANNPAVLGAAGLPPAATLAAYVCNYTPGGVNPVLLGSLGDYCFTTNLNGCTFGIGPVQPNNTRRVSHANSGGNTLLQRAQTMGVHGGNLAGVTLLEPAIYRRLSNTLNMQATVFGIRTGLNWQFYFQSFSSHGHGNLRVYGIFPIV